MIDAGALESIVSKKVVEAMKAHDAVRTGTLRLIKDALKNKAIEKRVPLTQPESEQILASMIKQRRDSIEQYTNGNRPELAAIEAAEILVIEEFLPKALDEAGLAALVAEAVAEVAASVGHKPGPKEMGPVIKTVQAKLQSSGLRAEGRAVSGLVKAALAS
jgi:uncharacterized protein YqeY